MPTLKATLTVPHRQEAERIADLLAAAFEAQGLPVAHFEDEENAQWLVDLYREGTGTGAFTDDIRDALGSDAFAAPLAVEQLDEVDWVTASLEGLQAIRAGRFVVYGLHARDAVGPTDIGIRVEASRAFGTGHHGTTLGCLELIEWLGARYAIQNALDLGTGTGVLAIALAKLTKAKVMATDIDPVSVAITAENAQLNHVAPQVTARYADGMQGHARARAPYDCIIANILAGPLIALASPLSASLVPGGAVILSGLMRHQERAVLARYRQVGLVPLKRIHHGEWSALLLMKR
ncbi:MAG: 50S ribosomal protein L11 methyltransferase [Devosiaceae bacterium]|nr:50S ribosomal protein L11 methyltransferase [Devosiaceae bacterium MH13]